MDGHDLPWHRVLRADGTCAPHIAAEQRERLRAEGVFLKPPPAAEQRGGCDRRGREPGARYAGREAARGAAR